MGKRRRKNKKTRKKAADGITEWTISMTMRIQMVLVRQQVEKGKPASQLLEY